MFKISALFVIFLSTCMWTICSLSERKFNFKPANVALRDVKSENVKHVISMSEILWNQNNHNLINYFKISSILNATEQLDTSGLFNFYVTLTKTECLKSNIKNWDLVEIETQKCLLTMQSVICPVRVLYQPWKATVYPITMIKPMEEKTQENSVCFLSVY